MRTSKPWSLMFYAAAAFNFAMGVPTIVFPEWSYAIAYKGHTTPELLRFFSDFGVCVVLIGVGYAIVGRDPTRNRGIVVLGILAKLFDVFTLTTRWRTGLANTFVLFPA